MKMQKTGKTRNYGLPYQGSKNRIAEGVINYLPQKKVFVDLFGGGGAISDCASQSGKYQRIIFNEIDGMIADTFRKALQGKYKDANRWISREYFKRLKDVDGCIAICYSFGNDCKTYLYSKELEPIKKAYHEAVISGCTEGIEPTRLIHLERLKRIQEIPNKGNIEVCSRDYADVELPAPNDCIIYCDIPYKDTKLYKLPFDYNRFYQWVTDKAKQGYQVYISSYELPTDRFTEVWHTERYSKLDSHTPQKVIERLYMPK